MRSPKSRASTARLELEETEAAFAHVREALTERLLGTDPTATAMLQMLVCSVQALDAVKAQLFDIVNAGAVEEYRDELNARSDT